MRSDFEESATKGRDISGNMLQHISCSVKSLIIEVALIIYLNVITIANNFKKWQRIVITNKCYSLSLCSKFLTTYFFNGLMANCGSQRERERERLCKTVLEARNRIEIDRRVSLREKSPSLTLGNLLSSLKFQASRMLV